jgi:Ser/Thr protein kinase RdoA (MazF antagonist)
VKDHDSRKRTRSDEVSTASIGLAGEVCLPGAAEPSRRISHSAPPRPRPIAYSTFSIDGIKQVLRAYDIDEPVEGTIFHRSMSDTYWLSTPQQQFALKIYMNNWRSREAITAELAAIRHAHARGVGVALPVARRDDGFITNVRAPEGQRSAVLFVWANGRPPKYSNSNHAYYFGQLLAKLHLAMEDFQCYTGRPHMDLDYMFRDPVSRIAARLGDLPEIARRFDRLANRIDEQLQREAVTIPDWGFCHGDVHIHNARIDGSRLVLFDFDMFGQGWRISDLATYRWQARRSGAEATAWPAFLEGYREIRPTIEESLRFTQLFMLMKHLWDKARYIAFAEQFDAVRITEEFLEDAVAFCEQLE